MRPKHQGRQSLEYQLPGSPYDTNLFLARVEDGNLRETVPHIGHWLHPHLLQHAHRGDDSGSRATIFQASKA